MDLCVIMMLIGPNMLTREGPHQDNWLFLPEGYILTVKTECIAGRQ